MTRRSAAGPINISMLLSEILAPHGEYHFGSQSPLSGEITRHDLHIEVLPRHHAVESILERARPPDCLSGAQCIFLATSRDGVTTLGMRTAHIYSVQPIGEVQRSDQIWWHMIRDGLSQH
jgi:hypothetical protein